MHNRADPPELACYSTVPSRGDRGWPSTLMTARWLRGTAFAALVVVLASAVFLTLDREGRIRASLAALKSVEQTAQRAASAGYDIRSSQQAYVATAQSAEWWHGRLVSHIEALGRDLGSLRQLTTDPGALNDLDAAAASLDTFAQVDERALRMVLAGQGADASLLIFSEGVETISTVVQRIDSARSAEVLAVNARLAVERRSQGSFVAAAAAVALLVAVFLLATGHARPRSAEAQAEEPPAANKGAVVPSAQPVDDPVADRSTDAPAAASDEPPPIVDRRRAAELHEAAGLCTDFARVVDAHELPGLLARAADLLEASGLIVWMTDADGAVLRPLLTHGYSAAALARLPAIARDADNATASSFRRAELRAVEAADGSPGAIVAPLLTASGCVGVLAVEVRNGREASEPNRAMARILAAQIATLVGGGPAREEIAPGQQAVG
ncbi:MAG: hypothetical protein H6Q08_1904 [Acidobacteria bacterium]|nr:hypothetical protein [Acidobacteriota bacterium]